MTSEESIVEFIQTTKYSEIPNDVIKTIKKILLATTGSALAGAREEGCAEIIEYAIEQQGIQESTILFYNKKIPAGNAALINATMSRALDFCDAIAPGLHVGSSLVPAALAAAEIRGNCSGKELLEALAIGAEVSSRMNLSESQYSGFDPTGVAGVFGATAAVSRILGLNSDETTNALALSFNRSSGSFQSNIDGSLAVRLIQGWVAETGIMCARLAKKGVSGPKNFISGIYGYKNLFGKGKTPIGQFYFNKGDEYRVLNTMFKKYPSCGLTQGATQIALEAHKEVQLENIKTSEISVSLPPYAFRLVGSAFELGSNPRVNAQFSAQYCVANALLRGRPTLSHFTKELVCEYGVVSLAQKIKIICDGSLEDRGHTAVDLRLMDKKGNKHCYSLNIAPGFPGNELTESDHLERFESCVQYSELAISEEMKSQILSSIENLETLDNVAKLPIFNIKNEITSQTI